MDNEFEFELDIMGSNILFLFCDDIKFQLIILFQCGFFNL